MNDIINTVDHAAQQSDRWLMLFMLVVLLAAGLLFWKWIINDRARMGDRLTTITDRHIESLQKLGEVVATNTTALNEFRRTTEQCARRQQT